MEFQNTFFYKNHEREEMLGDQGYDGNSEAGTGLWPNP
jgi:hypothetical protein